MNRRWVRVYADILDDEKIAKMSAKTFKFFIFLLVLCSEEGSNGQVLTPVHSIYWRFRITKAAYNKAIKELTDLNIISLENNKITIKNWSKRQYKSDSSTDRVKRYRNVSKTLHETPPDTDTETDTENIEDTNVSSCQRGKPVDENGNDFNYYYKEIPKIYARFLPELPQIIGNLSETRKSLIRARHKFLRDHAGWSIFFDWVSNSDFLMGLITQADREKPFKADFDWILKQSNFTHIIEGRYHKKGMCISGVQILNFQDFYNQIMIDNEQEKRL